MGYVIGMCVLLGGWESAVGGAVMGMFIMCLGEAAGGLGRWRDASGLALLLLTVLLLLLQVLRHPALPGASAARAAHALACKAQPQNCQPRRFLNKCPAPMARE